MFISTDRSEIAESPFASMFSNCSGLAPDGFVSLPTGKGAVETTERWGDSADGMRSGGEFTYTTHGWTSREYVIVGEWAIPYEVAYDAVVWRRLPAWETAHAMTHGRHTHASWRGLGHTLVVSAVPISDLLTAWRERMEQYAVSRAASQRTNAKLIGDPVAECIRIKLDYEGSVVLIVSPDDEVTWEGGPPWP